MNVIPHSPASRFLARPAHRWALDDRQMLAQALNGVVLPDSGDILFTGVLGMPERISFNQGQLWAFSTPNEARTGDSARAAIFSRLYWLGMDVTKKYGRGSRA